MRSTLFTPVLMLCSILCCVTSDAAVIYVDQNASGNNNGTSWAHAYTNLQVALSVAIFNDEIWVASGIYYPSAIDDREISFVMKNGVNLYGGFNGTETAIDQRDIPSNPTTLSGDIGQPGDNSDNSKYVMLIQNITQDLSLDGFRIVSGFHQVSGAGGAGIYFSNNTGADIFINNCLFYNNYGQSYGGALRIKETNVTFNSCEFLFNASDGDGGAIYASNTLETLNIYLTDCVFKGNVSNRGAAVFFGGDTLRLSRNLITKNTCTGGSIFQIGSSYHYTYFDNCLMTGNLLNDDDGSVIQSFSIPDGSLELTNVTICHNLNNATFGPYDRTVEKVNGSMNMYNSIIYGNTDDNTGTQVTPGENVFHSIIEHGYDNGVNVFDTDPNFINPGSLGSAPFDSDNFDYSLNLNSPGINSGNNDFIQGMNFDLMLNERIQQGIVDIGAIESVFIDNVDPLALCQDVTVQLNELGLVNILPEDIDAGSSDNMGIQDMNLDLESFTCDDIGTNSVELTVVDYSGNESSCTANVTVEDALGPNILMNDIILILDENGQALTQFENIDNGTFDNCQISSTVLSTTQFDCTSLGTNVIEVVATDVYGNVSTDFVQIDVIDTIGPVAMAHDTIVHLNIMGMAELNAIDLDEGSMDNCLLTQFELSQSSFNCSDIGTNQISFTVQDASGNQASVDIEVMVIDTFAPVIETQNLDVFLNSSGEVDILPGQVDDGSFDNCGIDMMTLEPHFFTCDEQGTHLVTLSVLFGDGTVLTEQATINVTDNLSPVTIGQDITIDLAVSNPYFITAENIDVASTDNCEYIQTIDQDSFTETGLYPVNLSTIDLSGNSDVETYQVEVIDTMVGITELESSHLNVIPNPTNGLFRLTSTSDLELLKISSSEGRVIQQLNGIELAGKSEFYMDLSEFAKGIYFITAQYENGTFAHARLILQ